MPTKAGGPIGTQSAADLIDGRIAELGGWRGPTLARMRALIRQADPSSRSGNRRRVEMERPGVVAQRDYLHRRSL